MSVSDGDTLLDGVSASLMTANANGVVGFESPTSSALVFDCAAPVGNLTGKSAAIVYTFRSHPRIKELLKIFSSVVLIKATVYVYQANVSAPEEGSATQVRTVRFGITPRGVTTSSGGTNVVGYIPNLTNLALFSASPASASVTFGQGGVPFPPGLQLDFRDLETRFNYAEFFLGSPQQGDGDDSIASAQISFTVQCSGSNFGSVY